MPKLLDFIFNNVPEDANPKTIFLFFIFASFIYCLFQANAIYDFVEKFNKREFSALKDLLADENISEKAKKTLKSKIDSIVYKNVTGITTDVHLQEKIINYYELADGRLRYSDFKKALTFLKIDRNGILTIRKPNIFEFIFYGYWILMSVFVFLVLFVLWFAFVYATISIRERIFLLLLIINFVVILLLFLSQASLIPTAKKIRNEIESNPLILQSNQKIIEQKQTSLKEKKLRPFGLCEGEFTVPDDFDDPLPEDILNTFEGK